MGLNYPASVKAAILASCLAVVCFPAWVNSAAENTASPADDKARGSSVDAEPLQPIPAHWQQYRRLEPVFQSRLFFVETGQPDKPVLLFVHGLGQQGLRDWLTVIPALEEDFRIIALDLPGFGQSETPSGRYSPTNYAKLLAWLVRERTGSQPVTVIGHSMGATVALRYAATFPEQVNKLVMVDAAGILERTAFIKHQAEIPVKLTLAPAFVKDALAKAQGLADRVVEWTGFAPDATPLLQSSDLAWNQLLGDSPNANAAMALIGENFSRAIAGLPQDTYLIWGEQDPIAPLRTGTLLRHRLNKAHLTVIPDAGHVPMKSHPALFNRALLAALTSGPLPAAAVAGGPTERTAGKDLVCNNESGKTWSGNYRVVTLNGCQRIRLENLNAEQLRVTDSQAELVNVSIENPQETGMALDASNAVVVATASRFRADTAIQASDSRLDLAGVVVEGRTEAVAVAATTSLIVSVSELISPTHRGYVHNAFRLSNTTLEAQFAD